jgi:hypothetical protein
VLEKKIKNIHHRKQKTEKKTEKNKPRKLISDIDLEKSKQFGYVDNKLQTVLLYWYMHGLINVTNILN